MPRMTGGDAIVDGLLRHGIDTVFGLPGVQMYGLFDAFARNANRIRVINARHEQTTAYMAMGYACATGRPAVYSVVPGPGVLNTTAALSTAWSVNAPVLCLTGQVPSTMIGRLRGQLHELPDQLATLRTLVRHAERIEDPTEAPRKLAAAFQSMMSGRHSPAALEIPLDQLPAIAEVTPVDPLPPHANPVPDPEKIARLVAMMNAAKNPMIWIGGGAIDAGAEIRALAEKHGVHRRTVRQALEGAEPPPRKTPVRVSPRLAPFKAAIDEMLTSDLEAPRKQRHTARRIHVRLIEEHSASELSYSTVRDYVRVRRAQIDLAAGRRSEVMVPQEHAPGAEAEVDFGEVYVILAGVKTKCRMFTFRLSYSGRRSTGSTPPRARRRSWRATSLRSTRSAGSRPATSGMTTSPRGCRRLSSPAATTRHGIGWRTPAGCCSGRITASMRSTASPASPGRMRRAASRARSGGFAAPAWCRCRSWIPSMSSTRRSACGIWRMRTGGSTTASAPSVKTSPRNATCWRRCRSTGSTPA